MHDIMVESIFPYKRSPEKKSNVVGPCVKDAVKKASERIKNYSPHGHRRSVSAMIKKSFRPSSRPTSEVRDVIYL